MKKYILFSLTFVVVLAIVSCGTTTKKTYRDYKEACEAGDWLSAYQLCEKIKDEAKELQKNADRAKEDADDYYAYYVKARESLFTPKSETARYYAEWQHYKDIEQDKQADVDNKMLEYENAIKYVVLQEATSVLQQKDLNMVARIPMIVKEHKALWLYEEIFSISRMIPDNDVIAVLSDVMLEDLTPKVMKPAEHSSWDEDVDQYMEEAQRYNMLLDKLVDHLLATNNEETKKYAVKGLAVPEADDNSQVVFSTEEARQIAAKVK